MYVFTDGAASDNGYKNCKAGWAVFFAPNDPRNEFGSILIGPSNQKAELFAIRMALQKTLEDDDVTIVTDSKYCINCLTEWGKTWEKNGWKTSKGQPVKHSTLIKECREMLLKHPVTFKHVHSHLIAPKDRNSEEWKLWFGNDSVDKLAAKGLYVEKSAEKQVVDSFKGKVISFDEEGHVVGTDAPAAKKQKLSNGKGGKARSKVVNGDVKADKFLFIDL